MNEFENNKNQENGTVSGFDAINDNSQESGYTVTPQGGFYNRKSEDIIQDQVINTPPINQEAQQDRQSTYTEYTNQNTPPTYSEFYNGYQKAKKPKKPKTPKNGHSTAVVIIASLLAAVIGATSGIAVVGSAFKKQQDQTVTNTSAASANSTNVNINVDETASNIIEAVAAKATDSVVGIRTTTSVANFFGGSQEQSGEGSGVIYTSDGYIITNYHVISEAVEVNNSKIEVFVGDNTSKSYQASVVGYNISCDLAVLKIDAQNLVAVELGNADDLKVGQFVVTIGAPGGLEFMGSVTYGVISGLNRVVSSDSKVELIQIDAAINPGNSGGALLNSRGQLIGINSSKIASVEFEGMGFAIPIDTVKEKCDKIIARENEPSPYIGVTISERYTAQVLAYYGYPSGAVISGVTEGSPADDAGIERGDIITEFNNTEITEYSVLTEQLNDLEPNDTVPLKIYRSGRYYSLNITIGANG